MRLLLSSRPPERFLRPFAERSGLCVALLCLAVAVGAQQTDMGLRAERIAVLPFVNTSQNAQWDELSVSLSETMRLTLALSGQFDIVEENGEPFDPYTPQGASALTRVAAAQRLDAVVIGRIQETDNERIAIEASVWETEAGRVVGTERREAFGSFDVLDAADELVILATSAILGYRIDFGAVLLRPSDMTVPYRVYLDGIFIGESVRSIPQVLSGRRNVRVTVVGVDEEQPVYSADRLIRAGEALEVVFGLPRMAPVDRERIARQHRLASDLLGQPDRYMIAAEALRESRELLDDNVMSAGDSLRNEQERLEAIWTLDEAFSALSPHDFAADGAYRVGSPFGLLGQTRRVASSRAADMAGVGERIYRNGAAQFYLLRLRWADAIGRSAWDEARRIADDMEAVVDEFDLDLRGILERDRNALDTAFERADGARSGFRNPLPYVGLAVGLGLGGVSAYSATVDTVTDIDHEAEWAITLGGFVSLVSTTFIIRDLQADERYLRGWAREYYGREIAT
ncbi:MAG: hypothetical protein MI724_18835, partial [Spirochaetales bacterium]|nr:hypothetical protein [Spirochaetales bacterium]